MEKIYPKVFMWLFVGLFITFGTGMFITTNPVMLYNVVNYYLIFILLELFFVIYLSARIQKMKYMTAMLYYLLYSFVTGITFSTLFAVFEISSIMYVFGITAFVFLIFAALGYFTKIDLSKISMILFMGLIAIIVMSLINVFVGNDTFDLIICIIGIVIFIGYIAYDMQKIRMLSNYISEDKLPIYGALQLYLDFINIFVYLLRIFGRRND